MGSVCPSPLSGEAPSCPVVAAPWECRPGYFTRSWRSGFVCKVPWFSNFGSEFQRIYMGQRERTAYWLHPGDSGPVSCQPAWGRDGGRFAGEGQGGGSTGAEARSGCRRGSIDPKGFVNVNSLYITYTEIGVGYTYCCDAWDQGECIWYIQSSQI